MKPNQLYYNSSHSFPLCDRPYDLSFGDGKTLCTLPRLESFLVLKEIPKIHPDHHEYIISAKILYKNYIGWIAYWRCYDYDFKLVELT